MHVCLFCRFQKGVNAMNPSIGNSQLCFIFVHGFQGWGSYDSKYQKTPYWGMRGGDLIAWLWQNGFQAYAASVDPIGSVWDRACELYAQLAGKRTDYGIAHSREYNHPRYGRDFTGNPLIPSFDDKTGIVLIGHSFGGITANLFAELMANGSAAEQEATDPEDLSPLFQGGMGDRIRSIAGIAAGFNGNSSYEIPEDYRIRGNDLKLPWYSRFADALLRKGGKVDPEDPRDPRDYAEYDMHIDRAAEINQTISVLPHVLYLSVPCSYTVRTKAGYYVPEKNMEPMFLLKSAEMGRFACTTEHGHKVDAHWWQNDGRVNTISEKAPFNAPQTPLDRDNLRTGVWNVFPVYHGSHMSLQGGLTVQNDIRPFYEDLLSMIAGFEETRI